MPRWTRRIRAGLVMGLTWALLWAPVGLLIGMLVDPDGSMDEPWLLVGALPGLLGGVAFSLVLGIVGRRRRFDELSISRFAAWGAAAGLLVGGSWVALAVASDPARWVLNALVIGFLTVLTSVSAAASLALARRAARRDPPDGGAGLDDAGLTEGEARELLGGQATPGAAGAAPLRETPARAPR